MTPFIITPQRITPSFLAKCEERGFIKTLKPTSDIAADLYKDAVATLYHTKPAYGGHKLICVRKNATDIVLTTHPEPEDVIFLNAEGREYKPLFLIMALCFEKEYHEKVKSQSLLPTDVIAVRIEYNNPQTCMFTICGGVPHCEVTVPGHSEAPLFYVTEPAEMTMNVLDSKPYVFELATSGH